MDELFNMLSSSARIDKSKRNHNNKRRTNAAATTVVPSIAPPSPVAPIQPAAAADDDDDDERGKKSGSESSDSDSDDSGVAVARKRRVKAPHDASKTAQIHRERVACFRRRMSIRVADPTDAPDPACSFEDLSAPRWWWSSSSSSSSKDGDGAADESRRRFEAVKRRVLTNVREGDWVHPTPIQMQAVPALLERRDVVGRAPTGSGKSGAFLLPLLFLCRADESAFYGGQRRSGNNKNDKDATGHVRSLVLTPSRELAVQLHREVERLGENLGLKAALLSKSNAGTKGNLGGKKGLDVLLSTPMRLADSLADIDLSRVRLVVLDEADRLLDARDANDKNGRKNNNDDDHKSASSSRDDSFLSQMDDVLAAVPSTAVRALFSATVGSRVRELAGSFLRDPVDVRVGGGGGDAATAKPDVTQKLVFVGREEGKLLAIRQRIRRGIKPPVMIFLQSRERATALHRELLYDGVNVDVLHAGRTAGAREAVVTRFRKGEVWVLICTDLVARGVDFKGVNLVINYDLPEDGVAYVHRIGRTGRAGRPGEAVTLYTEADADRIGPIANVMKHSGCEDVPEWLLTRTKKSGGGGGRRKRDRAPPERKRISTSLPEEGKKKKKKQRKRRKKGAGVEKGKDQG